MQHKVTTKNSLSYSDTIELRCTCGWYAAGSKTKFYTNSMTKVRQEMRWVKMDHLEDSKLSATK